MGREKHTITLFADDVILSLTNPAQFLIAVHEVLEMFNSVSYYKINASMSSILNMAVNSEVKAQIQKLLPYQWAEGHI